MEIQLWRQILSPYELAVKELTDKFNHIIWEHRAANLYSPIESVEGRVKSITSILDKMQKKGIKAEQIERKIEDIAGIRIICQFVEDIETVAEMIRNRSDMKVKYEKDYINHMKESGYRSYHMIIYYNVETLNGCRTIMAEIQIRTMAMDFWATIEHSLQYKYKSQIPEHMRKKLSKVADTIISLDNEMSTVRSEIMDAQNDSQLQLSMVADILNDIEIIFKRTSEREAIKIQDEFYRIYSMNDLEQLEKFHRQLDIIVESYRAQTVNHEYLKGSF